MASLFKKTGIKLELLKDNDMLLRIEKGIRGGITHAINRHAKANNKHMKNYNKNKESSSSCLMYLDANNLYRWAMSQKLPIDGFEWIDTSIFDDEFIKNYSEDSIKGYILEVGIEYPKNLHDSHSDLLFLSERIKINRCNKLVCNLHDKKTMLFT